MTKDLEKAVSLLKSDCEAHRKTGLRLLETIDFKGENPELKKLLSSQIKEGSPYLGLFTIELIGMKRCVEYSMFLITIATDRRSAMHLREKAVWALGRLCDVESVSHLLNIMTGPYDALSLYARDALSRIGKPVIKPLFTYIRNPELTILQREGLLSLLVELEADHDHKLHEFLDFMKKASIDERLLYLKSMRSLKAYDFAHTIEDKLDSNEMARTYSLDKILSRFTENREKLETIINKISMTDEQLALKILVALKKMEMGDTATMSSVVNEVTDTHILGMLASLLGLLENGSVLPLMVNLLHNTDRRVRANAVDAITFLPGLDDETVLGLLEPMLQDSDNRVRANTARALWKIGGLQMLEVLRRMVLTGEKWTRASAAYALGEIGVYQVVEILIEVLKTPDNDIRRNVIKALAKTREPEILTPLSKIALDPEEDYTIRKLAIEGICSVGSLEAAEILLEITSQFKEDPAIHQIAYDRYRELS